MGTVITDASSHSANSGSSKATAKEWRLFMSSRVSETLSQGASKQSSRKHEAENYEQEEFKSIFKEVQQLGISQMSWKRRKEIDTQKRIALGAKPEKTHRMPINMGLNIKRKREELEKQNRQEVIALGRSLVKMEKKSKSDPSTRGLKASEGVFRGGVLHVKPLNLKKEHMQGDIHHMDKHKAKQHRKTRKGKKRKSKKRR